MANQDIMKVLWVDNDPSIVEGTQQRAEQYDIDLPHFPNWVAAENELKDHFNEFSAIILDANCEFDSESVEDKTFLAYVMPRLAKLFGEMHSEIPWYVLSAGTMDEFDLILQLVNTNDRKKHNEDWGQLLYFKDKRYEDGSTDLDRLFKSIRKSTESTYTTKIRSLYSEVYRTINEKRNMLDKEIENILTPVLISLHFPETIKETTSLSNFTQLRQVIEYIFRACNQTGLLPDECVQKGKINIQESLRYLSGENTKHLGVRYGSQAAGDHLFPDIISDNLQQILNIANACTHTADEQKADEDNVVEYIRTVGASHMLYCFVLQLCDVVVWYGKYVAKHPDYHKNRKWSRPTKPGKEIQQRQPQKQQNNKKQSKSGAVQQQKENIWIGDKNYYDIIPREETAQKEKEKAKTTTNGGINAEAFEHQMMCAERDENGIWHCGKCMILAKGGLKEGERLEIYNIVPNIKETKDKYPLFAKRYNKLNF